MAHAKFYICLATLVTLLQSSSHQVIKLVFAQAPSNEITVYKAKQKRKIEKEILSKLEELKGTASYRLKFIEETDLGRIVHTNPQSNHSNKFFLLRYEIVRNGQMFGFGTCKCNIHFNCKDDVYLTEYASTCDPPKLFFEAKD